MTSAPNQQPGLHVGSRDPFLVSPYAFYRAGLDHGPLLLGEDNVTAWNDEARHGHEYILTRMARPDRRVWLLFSHDHCRWAAMDQEHFSVVRPYQEFHPETGEALPPIAGLLQSDGDDHARLLKLIIDAFKPRMIQDLEPRVQQVTDELLDAIPDPGNVDLAQSLCDPMPVIVIAELLGVPPEDRQKFQQWSDEAILYTEISGRAGNPRYPFGGPAYPALRRYFEPLMAERRARPRNDLISAIMQAEVAGHPVTSDEIIHLLILLLIAGNETTRDLISNTVVTLMEHPDQMTALDRGEATIPGAIEEVLRYSAAVQFISRTIKGAVKVGDRELADGDEVVMILGAANRDPAVFPDPDRFDVSRPNAAKHLTFGIGIHKCVGAPLARLEGRIALEALRKRWSHWRLLKGTDLPRFTSLQHRGFTTLPMAFSP